MTPRNFIAFTMMAALACGSAFAGKHTSDVPPPLAILEISPMALTVDVGNGIQQTYNITMDTRATLNGAPVKPEDLMAGMVAQLVIAPDGQTAQVINAQPAPKDKIPKKPHDNTVVVMHLKN